MASDFVVFTEAFNAGGRQASASRRNIPSFEDTPNDQFRPSGAAPDIGKLCSQQIHQADKIYSYLILSRVDPSYVDPIGPEVERPKTAARRRDEHHDEFADEELGDDLLPE